MLCVVLGKESITCIICSLSKMYVPMCSTAVSLFGLKDLQLTSSKHIDR